MKSGLCQKDQIKLLKYQTKTRLRENKSHWSKRKCHLKSKTDKQIMYVTV